jgi:hypothetical protein
MYTSPVLTFCNITVKHHNEDVDIFYIDNYVIFKRDNFISALVMTKLIFCPLIHQLELQHYVE